MECEDFIIIIGSMTIKSFRLNNLFIEYIMYYIILLECLWMDELFCQWMETHQKLLEIINYSWSLKPRKTKDCYSVWKLSRNFPMIVLNLGHQMNLYTFAIPIHSICQWLVTGQWFSLGILVSCTNNTDSWYFWNSWAL